MALDPSAAYPGQIDTTDPTGYPHGRAKNVASLGDGTGTPLEQQWISDLFGFEQALLVDARITPSTTPDKVGASQYLDALKVITRRERQSAQATNWPERPAVPASAAVDGPMGFGYAPDLGVNGGGLWVMQTSATDVWTSEDGVAWTQREAAGALAAASFTNPWIAYGKINGVSGFLLSQNGSPTVYYTSTDGITWTTVTTSAIPPNPVSAYSSSLGLWVMAGGTAGAVRTSPTALANTWTARTTPVAWQVASLGAKRIIWNGSLFVILPLAAYGKCLTSPDGITWTERALPIVATWTGLAYGAYDGIWMAGATSGAMATSTDGLTWAGSPFALAGGADLAVNGPVWVMPTLNAQLGGIIWSADKGATWHQVAVGNHRVATLGWNRILAADNRFMVGHGTAGGVVEIAMSQRALP